jgi:4'-phosphopantetheinyl transferase
MASGGTWLRPQSWCPPDPPPLPCRPASLQPGPTPPASAAALASPSESAAAGIAPPTLLLLDRRDPRLQAACTRLEGLLDPQERARLQRFHRHEDRQRHLLGRAALRLAVGAWLGRDPAALRFRYGPHGKPELADAGPTAPRFNLAHSGALVLLALHPQRPVGVDVERLRPDLDWHPIARRTLAAAELAALEALPADRQAEGFLRAWCRLEARLKASGEGLAGLGRLRAEPQPVLSAAAGLWEVRLPPDYAAAVALGPAACVPGP